MDFNALEQRAFEVGSVSVDLGELDKVLACSISGKSDAASKEYMRFVREAALDAGIDAFSGEKMYSLSVEMENGKRVVGPDSSDALSAFFSCLNIVVSMVEFYWSETKQHGH